MALNKLAGCTGSFRVLLSEFPLTTTVFEQFDRALLYLLIYRFKASVDT